MANPSGDRQLYLDWAHRELQSIYDEMQTVSAAIDGNLRESAILAGVAVIFAIGGLWLMPLLILYGVATFFAFFWQSRGHKHRIEFERLSSRFETIIDMAELYGFRIRDKQQEVTDEQGGAL